MKKPMALTLIGPADAVVGLAIVSATGRF